ncbi:MAG: hypothetical protein QOE98_2120, partial [Gaiellaceae bacterium]|nr:hypothetical protein [Gaiellaceae bacterium]
NANPVLSEILDVLVGAADDLIRSADGALFWTKSNGRNAICRGNRGMSEVCREAVEPEVVALLKA